MIPVQAVLTFPVEGQEATLDLLLSQREVKELHEQLALMQQEILDLEYDQPQRQLVVTLKKTTPLRRSWVSGLPPSTKS